MHENHGQYIGWRRLARRSGLTLAWLVMLVLLAVAAAAVVIAAHTSAGTKPTGSLVTPRNTRPGGRSGRLGQG
jgi:hypothetical protein